MGANTDFSKIRVSNTTNKRFKDLVDSKRTTGKKITYREAYDDALNFFSNLNMLPDEYEPMAKQLQKETGRYISFFRVAEKNIYSRIDSLIGAVGSNNTVNSPGGDMSNELFTISKVLGDIYQLIRLGFKLDLHQLEIAVDDDEVFDKIMEDFKNNLGEIEK